MEQIILAEYDFMSQFLKLPKIMRKISSRNSTLSIPIKIYLRSSLSSANEAFFTVGVITIFDATLFWDDFNSSSFSYLNVVIGAQNHLWKL